MKAGGFAALIIGFVLTASSVHAQSTPSLNLEGTGNLGPGPAACAPVGCSGLFSATLSGQLAQPVNQAALQMNLQTGNPFPCICGAQTIYPCPAVIPCVAPSPLPPPGAVSPAGAKAKAKAPSLESQIQALQQQTQSLQQEIDALGSGGVIFPLLPRCRPATGSGTFSGTDYSVNFVGEFCSDSANHLVLSGTISILQSPLVAGLVTWAAGTLVASGSIHIPVATNANPIPISGPMVVSIVGTVGEIPALLPTP